MFIYSDHNGDHIVGGAQDIQRLNGANFNLAPKIMTDETGQIVAIQGGELSLIKSMGIIEGLKVQAAEEVLRKSQKQSAQLLKKSFKPSATIRRTTAQQDAASRANKEGFTRLLANLDAMKAKQTQFMKAWS